MSSTAHASPVPAPLPGASVPSARSSARYLFRVAISSAELDPISSAELAAITSAELDLISLAGLSQEASTSPCKMPR
jgi:hypothetical protein